MKYLMAKDDFMSKNRRNLTIEVLDYVYTTLRPYDINSSKSESFIKMQVSNEEDDCYKYLPIAAVLIFEIILCGTTHKGDKPLLYDVG